MPTLFQGHLYKNYSLRSPGDRLYTTISADEVRKWNRTNGNNINHLLAMFQFLGLYCRVARTCKPVLAPSSLMMLYLNGDSYPRKLPREQRTTPAQNSTM